MGNNTQNALYLSKSSEGLPTKILAFSSCLLNIISRRDKFDIKSYFCRQLHENKNGNDDKNRNRI